MSLRWRRLERPEPVLPELLSGALHAITLPVLGETERADWAERLLQDPPGRHRLLHGEPEVYALGHMLAPSEPEPTGPDPERYLADAARDRPHFAAFEAYMLPILGALSARPARLASLDGRPCAFATLRVVPAGRAIPLHRDRYARSPLWERLAAQLDPGTLLSWYLLLTPAGGPLELCTASNLDYGAEAVAEPVPLGPGELVLFDAGRLFHRVAAGPGTRLTLGGFLAPRGGEVWAWG